MDLQENIIRIRTYRRIAKHTRTSLARAAGLGVNTLRHMNEDGWKPTSETILKLEAIIPKDFEMGAAE